MECSHSSSTSNAPAACGRPLAAVEVVVWVVWVVWAGLVVGLVVMV
jgi:hypothetical protein